MGNVPIVALQYVHILCGSILLGSSVFMNLVLWPAILRRPAKEAQAFYEASLKGTSVLMGASGGLVFLTGIIRGVFFGPIRSWDTLQTSYGITFLTALFIALAMLIHGPHIGPKLLAKVWKGNEFAPDAQAVVRSTLFFSWISVLVLLACMVLMHFGM